MSPEHFARLQTLSLQLAAKTKRCEIMAKALGADSPARSLLQAQRELGEDYIAFGAALIRFAEATQSEEGGCHAV